MSIFSRINEACDTGNDQGHKLSGEIEWWKDEIINYQKWYIGELKSHYGHVPPKKKERVVVNNIKDSAILTWLEVHQKPKYLADLGLQKNSFAGMTVLDIGGGPIPSAMVFKKSKIYTLDPLFPQYLEAGFPLHYYEGVSFVHAYSETIPLPSNFIDVVISVNAIDHVDDLKKTSAEIKRVLKPGGKIAIHAHYHRATRTEPIELNDAIFKDSFGWVRNLNKHSTSKKKFGSVAARNEKYVLWRNF